MNIPQNMHEHFAQLAPTYRQARTTDTEPIEFIRETLKGSSEIRAADIGCGAGRYDLLLFQHINNLHLTCVDVNASMLEQASKYLRNNGIVHFKTVQGDDSSLPLEPNSMDCILTFNAIHHFNFIRFIEQCAQVIKKNGKIFIYTRLRSQNARNIWGQHFPFFTEKETRLYELDEMRQWIQSVDSLSLETVKSFRHKRQATLDQLVERARIKHYSTFSLYEKDEFEEALIQFQQNIKQQFQNVNRIEWYDENILLLLIPTTD